MGTSRPISLFSDPPKTHQKPLAFMVSIFLHVSVAGLILYGFLFAPRINMREAADRYTMRRVDLTSSDPERILKSGDSAFYPGQQKAARAAAGSHAPDAASAASRLQLPKLKLADRTIVQPDMPDTPIVLKNTPMPSLLIWAAQQQRVKVVAPTPAPKMANVNAKATLVRPTVNQTIADVPFSSTSFTSKMPMPNPGTSTPIQVNGPDLAQRIPQTPSSLSTETPSGAVMSIAEMRMSQGTILVPAVNQTAPGNPNGALGAGKTGNNPQQNGAGNSPNAGASNNQHGQGSAGNSTGPAGAGHGNNPGPGANGGPANGNNGGGGNGGTGGGQGNEPGYTRINLPPNGQFSVVVVGSANQEQYPESADLWGRRIIYSVYLRVGLAKNWILQYSLPEGTPVLGNSDHLDAPWPYYIVRPTAGLTGGGLMIHGYLDAVGHFQNLAVEFPPRFRQAQLILQALQQWKFRPAKHNGQDARLEVVLIIPGDDD